MASGRFVSYLRCSTEKQGRSGLGLEAQRKAVTRHLYGGAGIMVAEVVEVESGKRNDRPRLAEALALCRIHNATLIIAKLDRLARNVHFVSGLMEAGVDFIACDFPQANRLTVHILAAVAEHEAAAISARTKAALAAAKARGIRLGNPQAAAVPNADQGRLQSIANRSAKAIVRAADLLPVIRSIQEDGAISLRQIATRLNEHCIPTARGGKWSATQVRRLLARQPSKEDSQPEGKANGWHKVCKGMSNQAMLPI